MIPFLRSDTWLFLSVAIGDHGEGVTLKDVIAAGDRINHSIFNLDELRRGFAKLTAAGYVRGRAGRFFLTGEGHNLYKRACGSQSGTLETVWEALNELMACSFKPADPSAIDDECWTYPSVTAQAVREGIDEYYREFLAACERRNGKQ